MIDVKEELDTYLADLAHFEKGADDHPVLTPLRREAVERFQELGFPDAKDEEWRFTNLAPLARVPFKLAGNDPAVRITPALQRVLARLEDGPRIVIANGHFVPELSRTNGVSLGSVADEPSERIEPFLGRHASFEKHPFVALNTAFLRDGVFLRVSKGQIVERPVHVVYFSGTAGEPTVSHPRALFVAEPGSQATVVESYVGPENDVYFTNAVTEIVVGEGAVLDHYKVQRESTEAFHIATLQVHMSRSSKFSSHSIALGGSLVRNEANAELAGESCECTLNGLVMAADRQLIDNHTRIDHAKPHCASHELYKHILDGHSRGVFNGKIYVHPDAQKTDAKQTNQTLLLSPDAVMDTKPQLEIFADDVKCTHGATIGQLQEAAIFYLRARGIGRDAARQLLTFAFANDIVERIKVRPVRAQLEEMLLARQGLPAATGKEETP
jgi:Fe-S cluster assembly protein SufD